MHEKTGRIDDAMAAYVEFESRFARDRRARRQQAAPRADPRRAARQPAAQAQSRELLSEVAREYPGTPQAQLALQTKLRIETERKDLRGSIRC